MRKTLTLLALALAVAALPVAAQDEMTLEQVLDNHFEAMGGRDTIKAMQSARMTGKMTLGPGAEAPFNMTFKRPMKMRLEFTFQGMTGVQAYDGNEAWAVMPFMGKTDPELMADDQAKSVKEQADLDGPLMDWQDKGNQVELLGKEEVEGTPAYKIKVTLANGDVRTHYLDADSFVTIKLDGTTSFQGNEVEFETTLSDYDMVDGLAFPKYIESRPKGADQGQVITIDTIEVNPEVADDIFAMPTLSGDAPAEEPAG